MHPSSMTMMVKAIMAAEVLLIGLMLFLGRTNAFGLGVWIVGPGSSSVRKHVVYNTPTWTTPWILRWLRCHQESTAISGSRRISSSSSSTTTEGTSPLASVYILTDWLQTQDPVARLDECIEIAIFGRNLRGIKWVCPAPLQDEPRIVASIPAQKVLRSTYPSPTWDAQLAWQILDEHRKGSSSAYYPYIRFLTSDQPFSDDVCPAPLAPHALRHWTEQQLDSLSTTIAGRRLLELHAEQGALWRTKYDALRREHSHGTPSWEHFAWAMEAVHSRAYIGASMESRSTASLALTFAPPIVAAVTGVLYADAMEAVAPPLVVWGGLAAMASLPLISSMLLPLQKSAVMLPLIDVANHCAEAASSIRFDPLSNCFDLIASPRHCVDQSNGQLLVSYGDKSDVELLLNYGFIPNDTPKHRDRRESIPETAIADSVDVGEDDESVRCKLATLFNTRNSDEETSNMLQ